MTKLITGDSQISNPEVMNILRQLARERFAETITDLNTSLEAARYDKGRTAQLAKNAEAAAPMHIAIANGSDHDEFNYQLARLSLKNHVQDPDAETVSYLVKLWAQAQLEANRILVAKVSGKFTEAKVIAW